MRYTLNYARSLKSVLEVVVSAMEMFKEKCDAETDEAKKKMLTDRVALAEEAEKRLSAVMHSKATPEQHAEAVQVRNSMQRLYR